MNLAPVLFISHGAPTFALEPGVLGPRLRALGEKLSGVAAALVVSPHWQTRDLRVMAGTAPATMHDFGGFPRELYELNYPARGEPAYAAHAARLLTAAGYGVSLDDRRGLDHGAWVPLWHLLPGATVPVFQVSMPVTLDAAGALRVGRVLAPLRNEGVMIVGSGSLTHNLYDLRAPGSGEVAYAREFAEWVRKAVTGNQVDALAAYRRLAPHAQRAHPSEEHFLPLLVAVGARAEGEAVQVIEGGITYGALSMDSYAWGIADQSVG